MDLAEVLQKAKDAGFIVKLSDNGLTITVIFFDNNPGYSEKFNELERNQCETISDVIRFIDRCIWNYSEV